jgi:hypothetical protein
MTLLRQLVECLGLLERRQVLALEVLHQRQLHHFRIADLADDHGDVAKADLDGGVIPPLAGDDLVAVPARPYDQRLDDALLGDRGHELGQVAHDLPRLLRIRVEELDRDEPADRIPRGAGQRLNVMFVMPHSQRIRQSALRHAR